MNQNPEMLHQLAVILHTLTCQKEHARYVEELVNRAQDENLCFFYVEESLVAESRIDQKKWEAKAQQVCQDYNLPPEEILRIVPQLLEIRQKLTQLKERYPTSEELFRLILFYEL